MNNIEKKEFNRSLIKWDNYYYNMCKSVATNSSCLSRHIGSILVKDKSIISTGYNGPPRGIMSCDKRWLYDKDMRIKAGFERDDGSDIDENELMKLYETKLKGVCPRYIPEMGYSSGQGLEWCVAGHSERNTLINAAREGIQTKGCKVYMDCGLPCTPCMVELINAGIEEIIITKFDVYDISANYLKNHTKNMSVRLYFQFCEHKNIMKGQCLHCGAYVEFL